MLYIISVYLSVFSNNRGQPSSLCIHKASNIQLMRKKYFFCVHMCSFPVIFILFFFFLDHSSLFVHVFLLYSLICPSLIPLFSHQLVPHSFVLQSFRPIICHCSVFIPSSLPFNISVFLLSLVIYYFQRYFLSISGFFRKQIKSLSSVAIIVISC